MQPSPLPQFAFASKTLLHANPECLLLPGEGGVARAVSAGLLVLNEKVLCGLAACFSYFFSCQNYCTQVLSI